MGSNPRLPRYATVRAEWSAVRRTCAYQNADRLEGPKHSCIGLRVTHAWSNNEDGSG